MLGVVAVARTVGTMYEYRMLWTWIVGGLAACVIVLDDVGRGGTAVPAGRRLRRAGHRGRARGSRRGVEVVQAATATRADWDSASTAAVLDRLSTKLDRHGGEIILRSETPGSEWYLQGVLLGLNERGFPARVRGTGGGLYPESLVSGRGRDQAHLQVVAGPDLARLTPAEIDRIVAYGGPLPLRQELVAARARGGAIPPLVRCARRAHDHRGSVHGDA